MIFEQKNHLQCFVLYFSLLEIKLQNKTNKITKMTNNIMVKFLNMYLYLFTINNQIGVRELTLHKRYTLNFAYYH